MFPTARRNRWTAGLTPKPTTARKAPALRLEQLEVRDTPATFTWTGAGTDSNWGNRLNWAGGVAPTGNPANVDDLVFPGTAAQRTTTNNITGGVFNTITIGSSGYTLAGRPLTLGGISGASNSGALIVAAAAVNNVLAIDTTLGAAAGNFQTFSVNSSAELTVTGRLFGTPGSTLTKDGTGTLVLSADNRGFPGTIRLNNNSGNLVVTDPNALGTTSAPTTIAAGSALRLRNLSAPLPEPLILNGLGVSNDGAVSSTAGTANVLSGTVRMDSDAALGASAGTVLTVTGVVSDTSAGFNLFKKGEGEVKLASPTGNTYRLQTFVDNGVLTVTHPRALGADNSPTSGTVVSASLTEFGQLRLEAPAGSPGFTVRDEFLTLNGSGLPGLANPGALTATRGNNDWAGPVTLGSPRPNVANEVTVAAAAGTNLTLSGVLASPNLVLPLVKDDLGRVILNNANTYAGTTVVARGTLNVRDSSALGTTGDTGGEVQGVQVVGSAGSFTLTFDGATTTPLAFNATAAQVAAALNALPSIGGVVVNGAPGRASVVASPMTGGTQYTVTFGGALGGRDQTPVVATAVPGSGTIVGTYVLREGGVAATAVVGGAALELEVEALLAGGANPTDSHGRDLTLDSVTGDPVRLRMREPVTIGGRGLTAAGQPAGQTGGLGALRSVAGINTYEALITLATGPLTDVTAAAIGVDGDTRLGHPTPSTAYFTDDYSLTAAGLVAGGSETDLVKRNGGHLIFPFANPYLGVGRVEQGWVTIQDADALGGLIPGRGDTVQPRTLVSSGAAVHVRPRTAGTTVNVRENITLAGVGPAHGYNFISRKGALVNLGGANTWSGDIQFAGQAGIGVEQVVPVTTAPSVSDLTLTGSTTDTTLKSTFTASGGTPEFARVIDTLAPSGTVSIQYEAYSIPDTFRVYYPSRADGGSAVIDTGPRPLYGPPGPPPDKTPPGPILLPGAGTATATFGPGAETQIEVVVNEGGGRLGTAWDLLDVTVTAGGGLIKLGSKKLNLRGDGTYTGATEVREGTVRVQNDTALGRASTGTAASQQGFIRTTTEVSAGAVLELEESNPREAAGVTAGLQVWHEALTLNRSGQQVGFAGPIGSTFKLQYGTGPSTAANTTADPFTVTTAGPTAAQVRDALAALPAVKADFPGATPDDPGVVTVTRNGNVYTILFGTALNRNAAQLQAVALTAGAEVSVSGGNFSLVTLGGDHAWRDTVSLVGGPRLETRPSSRLELLGPVVEAGGPAAVSDLVKRGAGELLLAGANSYRGTTAVDEGILTAAGERVFGDTVNGTRVANGAQLQIQGNLTISGEPLTLEGSGPGVVPAFEDTVRWLSAGPGPTNGGHSGNNLPTTGKVTSVATDPSDPDVIYVAAGGGGAWKTKNGGRTWVPLFDHPPEGLGTSVFGGSVAVAASDPKVVYFATGDGRGAPNGNPIPGPGENAAGAGVYRSTDSGHTWTLLVGLDERNPLAGQAITKIVVDPTRPDRVYVASGTSLYSTPTGSVGVPNSNPQAVPGVYRFTGTPGVDGAWFNLTGGPSPNRASVPGAAPYNAPPGGLGPPENAGPDDDYRLKFPQRNATWSDILLVKRSSKPYSDTLIGAAPAVEFVLYAALGESNQSYYSGLQPKDDANGVSTQGIFNAVYRTEDPDTTTVNPTWWLGNGTVFPRAPARGPDMPPPYGIPLPTAPDARGPGFPVGPRTPPIPYQPPGRNGWIQIAGGLDNFVGSGVGIPSPAPSPAPDRVLNYYLYGMVNAHITMYASSTFPDWHDWRGAFQDVQRTGWDGGINTAWAATTAQPGNPALENGAAAANPAYRDLFGTATRDTTLGGPAPIGPEYRNITPGSGRYNHAILAQDPFGLDNFGSPTPNALSDNNVNVVYIAGQGGIWRSVNGGANWARIDLNAANQPAANRPAAGNHALALDASNRLIFGTDGGVWRWDNAVTDPQFTDINGDLVIAGLNSADPHPNDLFRLTAGTAGTGTQQTGGDLVWARVDDDTGTRTGVVRYDPLNPQTLYAVRNGLLRKSTDGGANWVTLRQVGTAPPASDGPPANDAPVWNPARLAEVALVNPLFPGVDARADQLDALNYVPLVIDTVNPFRILIGGEKPRYVGGQLIGQFNVQQIVYDNLFQSLDGGQTFTNLNAGMTVSAIGIATYQGPFTADPDLTVPGVPPPGFPNVADKLSNTYDPDTIYVAGYLPAERGVQVDQQAQNLLRVTKDGGVSWVTRTPPGVGAITDIAVDPGNRDVVYVSRAARSDQAGGRVYKSDDAGRTWSDVTGSDPDMQVPAHKLTLDPRTGTLYLGNENGVWVLPNASTSSASVWVRLGAGLPRTAVRDIVVNQALNTVTVATAGRGAYQLFLTDYVPNSGALRAVSGSSVWTGPVTLTGPTTISADGNAAIQNGISGATLNIVGAIGDAVPGSVASTVTKIGLGTVTFSGTNTYAGVTLVTEGVLQANNPKALGAADPVSNTLITPGAALELRADLELEPITARGRGFLFNGHFTGSVRNVSNNNTYTGRLTLATDTTIGVDSGTTLVVGAKPGLAGTGTIDDLGQALGIDKELPGTLVLAAPNTYDGQTLIRQGAVRVEDAQALGSTGLAGGVDTRVLDGAQLQLARNAVTGLETVVAGESLSLSGSGIDGTGAILNVHAAFDSAGANNVWRGPVTLTLDPNTSPPTNPPSQVSLGVDDALDTLTIDGVVDQVPGQTSFGLVKVGPGRVTLTRANTFTGVTNVDRGSLRVQAGGSLGPALSTEVQTVSVLGSINPTTGDPYTFRLSYNGASTAPISATLVDASVIRSKLGALPTVGGASNLLVNETPARGGTVYTITFVNALADADRPQIVATDVSAGLVVNVATPQQGGLGTVVAAGGTLELDGGPTGGFIISEVLSLSGDGFAGSGALFNVAETNTYAGPITLAADAGVGAAADTTLVVTGTVRDQSPVATPAPRLRKAGAGTVEVRASNPYAGRTLVDEGVLRITNRTALGFSGAEVQLVQVTGTNGTFSLTFRGQTTTALPFNAGLGTVASAADVRAALELLPAVGAGGVTVTETGTATNKTFRVTFAGVLAAANQPLLTAGVTGSTSVGVTTEVEGPEGTIVADGATLQLSGGLVFDREVVTINGAGLNGQGALNNFNGNNTFATPLILGSASAIGTTAANQVLSVTAPIDEADTDPVEEEVYDLDIVGTGVVSYDGSADNRYSGTTAVKNGTLRLNQTAGSVAVNGPLVVGGAGNLAAAVAARDDQVRDNQPVTVNAQGTFNLNGRTDTVGALTVNTGTVQTGAAGNLTTADVRQTGGLIGVGLGGTLTAAGLTQVGGALRAEAGAVVRTRDIDTTGGTIELRDDADPLTAPARLRLNGNVTAASSAVNAPAGILGPGPLDLDGADRTFAVADGPAAEDLRVSAVPVGTAAKLIKAGSGRLALSPATPSAVTLQVTAGDLQADADVGPVELAGGSLSGVGSVDAIGGVAGAAAGTVSPGRNWQTNPAGRLTATGDVVWGAGTTFFVDLDASQHPNPVPATDYDQLRVTGSIDLGGATLAGDFNPGVLFGDRFVIIEAAGGVTGTFAVQPGINNSPESVFIDGQKFRVILTDGSGTPYPPNDPRITRVVLEKIKADVTVGVASSANPSTLRQEVIFTATVVPEPGAGPIPAADTVTFVVDGVAYGPFFLTNGQATFSSLNLPGGFLAAGPHEVYVTFSGDALNFFPATSPTIVQVVEAPAIAPLVGGPTILSPTNATSVGTNDVFTAATTISEQRAVTTVTTTVRNAAGVVVRTYVQTLTPAAGTNTIPVSVSFNGKANDLPATPALPDGDYTVQVAFADAFGNTAETAPLTVEIDDTSPVSTAPTTPTPVIAPGTAGQVPATATLTATVTDANLDFWTVTVADKATGQVVRTYTGAAGATAVNVTFDGRVSDQPGAAVLPDGVYTITVTARDTAGNTNVPVPANVREVVILTTGPVVSVGSNTPTVYGDAITLTTTVSVPFAAVADFLIGGSVLFYNGPALLGSDTLEKVGGQYTASLTVPTFAAGVYPNITVQFPGNATFLPAVSAPHTHTVTPAVLSVTADDQTKAYGAPLPPLTYRVTGLVNGDAAAAVVSGALGTAATAASDVGTYPIVQGGLAANGNYTVAFTPGTLTVTPVPLTIRVNDATRVFNRPDPVFTATYEGLLLNDTPAVVQGLVLGTTATAASRVGTFPIVARGTPTALNYTITVVPGTLTITPIPTEIDVGSGSGGVVRRFDPTGAAFGSVAPFPGFAGSVRTASADFNKDGVEDYAVATGPGAPARVTVFDGNTDQVLFTAFPFEGFEGGLFLSAGDLTGDGQADLVVTPDEGGGPRVQIYRGGDYLPVINFFGIQDRNFRGGIRTAVGDINGDGFADLAVAAGFGGGPRVSIWDGKALSQIQYRTLTGDFFAFDTSLRNGVYVGIGDLDGDGLGDVFAGAGPGGGPRVAVFSGRSLLSSGSDAAVAAPIANFFAGNPGNRGGVRVAVKNLDGDLLADLVVGDGEGAGSHVTAYLGKSFQGGIAPEYFGFDAFPGTSGGVFVG